MSVLPPQPPVSAVEVLPDGRVATSGVDRRVPAWDPDMGQRTVRIRCSVGFCRLPAFCVWPANDLSPAPDTGSGC